MMNINVKAIRKIISADFSYQMLNELLSVRMDKNDKKLQAINSIAATPVNSSMSVTSLYFDILREVNTIRQNPSKLDEVFKICEDLLFAIVIINLLPDCMKIF